MKPIKENQYCKEQCGRRAANGSSRCTDCSTAHRMRLFEADRVAKRIAAARK